MLDRSPPALHPPRSTIKQFHRGLEFRTSVWYSSTLLSISLPPRPTHQGGIMKKMQKEKPQASSSSRRARALEVGVRGPDKRGHDRHRAGCRSREAHTTSRWERMEKEEEGCSGE